MNSSVFDMLPPELQMVPVALAGVAVLAGLVLWSAGIKVARGLVAGYLGLAIAGVAMWKLPAMTGMAVITSAIIGLVIGVMAGAVAFRFVQGVVLGLVMGVAVAGGYYAWQANGGAVGVAATQAADLQISLARLPERVAALPAAAGARGMSADKLPERPALENLLGEKGAMVQQMGEDVAQTMAARWTAIPELMRRKMTVLGIAAALAMLIVSLLFPKHTTWVMTAAFGTVLLVAGIVVLMQVYTPQYANLIPAKMEVRWGLLAVVMLTGMLLQRGLFWRTRKEREEKQEKAAETAAA